MQSGDATEIEKNAMRSVLGALGYLARESWPDWSDWLTHTQISHCLFAKFPQIKYVLCLTEDASGGSTRAGQAQAGYVVMIADQTLLEGMAAPMTLVSWRCHHVKRVVDSASAAEAMDLSEAIAQCVWIVVVGLSLLRMERTRKRASSHIGHGFEG